jgi:hypothetical protein
MHSVTRRQREERRKLADERNAEHNKLSLEQKLEKVLKRNAHNGGQAKREVARLSALIDAASPAKTRTLHKWEDIKATKFSPEKIAEMQQDVAAEIDAMNTPKKVKQKKNK